MDFLPLCFSGFAIFCVLALLLFLSGYTRPSCYDQCLSFFGCSLLPFILSERHGGGISKWEEALPLPVALSVVTDVLSQDGSTEKSCYNR